VVRLQRMRETRDERRGGSEDVQRFHDLVGGGTGAAVSLPAGLRRRQCGT
jgi:hypothetical protein